MTQRNWSAAAVLLCFLCVDVPAQSAFAQIVHVPPPPQLKPDQPRAKPTGIDWQLVHRVHALICSAGIKEPKIVMAQAILETGWFRDSPLMRRNNLFGFRSSDYLKFESVEESVAYYKNWQDANMREGEQNYLGFLERIRYGAPGYSAHVRKVGWDEECQAN